MKDGWLNKIGDLPTNPRYYQKKYPSEQGVNNEQLEKLFINYLYGPPDKGIEISRRETKKGTKEEYDEYDHRDYKIVADSILDFLNGDYIMDIGIWFDQSPAEFAYPVVVREGKRMIGFFIFDTPDNIFVSDKSNETINDYKEFCEPDKIIEGLTEEKYLARLKETWKNVQTGSPRFFRK